MDFEKSAVEILESVANVEGLGSDVDLNLFEAGLLDSLAIIRVIIEIENRFNVKLQPTDFTRDDISSVKAFAYFLKGCVKQ